MEIIIHLTEVLKENKDTELLFSYLHKRIDDIEAAAESRIRDVDMAEAMVDYSKENILVQVGQSMMAQANQSVDGVLALLQ